MSLTGYNYLSIQVKGIIFPFCMCMMRLCYLKAGVCKSVCL